jgi:TfoX/Sxy family transcriptional regulator of competence genes
VKKKSTRARSKTPAEAPKKKSQTMPQFTKAPSALVETFQSAIAGFPDVQSRQMFGYPAAFTNTQMFAGLFQDKMILRLSETDREAIARDGARPFEPMKGRPMREYVVVPNAIRESSAMLRPWIAKAHGYARSLPPKKK